MTGAVGRCGDRAPLVGRPENATTTTCHLDAGHPGWHHDGEGCEWTDLEATATFDGPVAGLPVLVTRQAQAIAILAVAVAVNVASDVFVLGVIRGWWS